MEKNPLSLTTARRAKAAIPKVIPKSEHVFKEAMKLCLPSAEEMIWLGYGDAANSDQYLDFVVCQLCFH
jgi:hypothetical protein